MQDDFDFGEFGKGKTIAIVKQPDDKWRGSIALSPDDDQCGEGYSIRVTGSSLVEVAEGLSWQLELSNAFANVTAANMRFHALKHESTDLCCTVEDLFGKIQRSAEKGLLVCKVKSCMARVRLTIEQELPKRGFASKREGEIYTITW